MDVLAFTLEKKNKRKKFQLNYNNPYLEIIDLTDKLNSEGDYSLKLIKTKNNGEESNEIYKSDNSSNVIQLDGYDNLFLEIETENDDLKIEVSYKNFNLIENEDPLADFEEHLSKNYNNRVFFSAPFGSGKTTFLKYFFNKKENDYLVFKLFPINYPVGNNEDIFKYIKADILIQLLSIVEFEKLKLDVKDRVANYLSKNATKTLTNLTSLFILLYQNDFNNAENSILNIFNNNIKKIKSFIDALDKPIPEEYNNAEDAELFIQKLIEKEGSIFESNFYSQLINHYIDKLKKQDSKKIVLLIDDLDRIDPKHIFRILNILSVHYDIEHSFLSEIGNKFGFDKIIISAHIENIESIYHHFYGEKTDFDGYISKFYGQMPFKFDSKKVTEKFINQRFGSVNAYSSKQYNIAKLFLILLVNLNLISLRDIFRFNPTLLDTNFNKLRNKTPLNLSKNYDSFSFKRNLFIPLLMTLIDLLGENFIYDSNNRKITSVNDENMNIIINLARYLFTALLIKNDNNKHSAEIENRTLYFKILTNPLNDATSVDGGFFILEKNEEKSYNVSPKDFFFKIEEIINTIKVLKIK